MEPSCFAMTACPASTFKAAFSGAGSGSDSGSGSEAARIPDALLYIVSGDLATSAVGREAESMSSTTISASGISAFSTASSSGFSGTAVLTSAFTGTAVLTSASAGFFSAAVLSEAGPEAGFWIARLACAGMNSCNAARPFSLTV